MRCLAELFLNAYISFGKSANPEHLTIVSSIPEAGLEHLTSVLPTLEAGLERPSILISDGQTALECFSSVFPFLRANIGHRRCALSRVRALALGETNERWRTSAVSAPHDVSNRCCIMLPFG